MKRPVVVLRVAVEVGDRSICDRGNFIFVNVAEVGDGAAVGTEEDAFVEEWADAFEVPNVGAGGYEVGLAGLVMS
jgi:hypothetical protein